MTRAARLTFAEARHFAVPNRIEIHGDDQTDELVDAHGVARQVAHRADERRACLIGDDVAQGFATAQDALIENDVENDIDRFDRFVDASRAEIKADVLVGRARSQPLQTLRWRVK